MKAFSQELWQEILPIHEQILAHPFNRELAAGTLPSEKFQFYLKQDALYLIDFARALALIGARSSPPESIVEFLDFAKETLVVERALHDEYFRRFDITLDAKQSPACLAYTSFLVATAANRGYEEAVAGVLPCFWIYREVGLDIVRRAAPDNIYQLWIDTYSGEEFAESVNRAIAITDAVAAATTSQVRSRMMEAFVLSSRLEWMFWDSAYRLEQWRP